MTILFQSNHSGDADVWRRMLARHLPGEAFRVYPDELGEPAEIDYALVWKPPRGMLGSLPNLKAIFSLGAGVDHLATDPELPTHVPVVRLVDPGLTERMTEFVTLTVLRHHRRLREYEELQRAHAWEELPVPLARDRRVYARDFPGDGDSDKPRGAPDHAAGPAAVVRVAPVRVRALARLGEDVDLLLAFLVRLASRVAREAGPVRLERGVVVGPRV
jgi:hypothetical protein